jgi:ABC-2 type transport system permease protein
MWFSIINVMMAIMVIASAKAAKEGNDGPPVLFMYGIFGGMFVAFGVMIIMQRVLIREKQSGTAAWVLSKPVTRTAFVVSRLVVNAIAILLTSVIMPGVILYVTLGLFSDFGWLSPLGFAAALLMVSLHTFYWIALVLMMGTLFESSAGVIAVPMTLFFVFWMGTDLLPGLIYVAPLLLAFTPAPDQMNSLAGSFMTGEPAFSWLPLISMVVSCVIFIAVAIWRFNRQEF